MKRLSLLVTLSLTFIFLCSIAFAGGIGWEAEDFAAITPPQAVFEDANVSGGMYVTSPDSNVGSVEYEFEIPADGTYFMWAYHLSIDAGSNSCYLVIDDPASPLDIGELVWDTILAPQPTQLGEVVDIENRDEYDPNWSWIRVFGREDGQWMLYMIRTFELSAGTHRMFVWTRESNTKIDCYYLTNNFNDQPVFPDEVLGFAAVDPAKKLAITWGLLK